LTIDVLKAEHLVNSTVSLNILNGIGQSLEIQPLELVPAEDTDTTTTAQPEEPTNSGPASDPSTGAEEEEGGVSTGGVVAIVFFIILGVGAGVYFYRKRNGAGSERMPLSGASMSSLSSSS